MIESAAAFPKKIAELIDDEITRQFFADPDAEGSAFEPIMTVIPPNDLTPDEDEWAYAEQDATMGVSYELGELKEPLRNHPKQGRGWYVTEMPPLSSRGFAIAGPFDSRMQAMNYVVKLAHGFEADGYKIYDDTYNNDLDI